MYHGMVHLVPILCAIGWAYDAPNLVRSVQGWFFMYHPMVHMMGMGCDMLFPFNVSYNGPCRAPIFATTDALWGL